MNYERSFSSENPYLEQTGSWKEGMKYLYSPDYYPLSVRQYRTLKEAGESAGLLLEDSFPQSAFVEFRLDFVKDYKNNLWITELQTDDRGLPAVTTARNARGNPQPEKFPEIPDLFMASLGKKAGKKDFSLVIVYPEKDYFYYAGFNDFTRYCRMANPEAEIIVSADSQVNFSGNEIRVAIPLSGVTTVTDADFIWDFSGSILSDRLIQPPVTKQLLQDIWACDTPVCRQMKKFVPQVYPVSAVSAFDKSGLILKPVNGKWSRGVVIGNGVSDIEWAAALNNQVLLAQKYIDSPREFFTVRTKSGDFVPRTFYSRIEGYYIKNDGRWVLADVLATCAPVIPVHGMRESIMIPAKIEEK